MLKIVSPKKLSLHSSTWGQEAPCGMKQSPSWNWRLEAGAGGGLEWGRIRSVPRCQSRGCLVPAALWLVVDVLLSPAPALVR